MNSLTLEVADGFGARLRGLLGRAHWPPGRGLWLEPCDAVHTFGMRFSIDVVFVDATGRIRRIDARVKPWRMRMCIGAFSVVELAAGEAQRLGLAPGDAIGPGRCA